MMNIFNPVSDNILQAANKGATRLLQDINSVHSLSEEKQALLYFQFIHIFCLLYEKQTDFKLLKQYLKKCEKYNQIRIPIMDMKNEYYGCFWNVFLTTDLDGEKCEATECLYNIKTVTNEDKDLYVIFEQIANSLNPVFYETVKKHSFTFVYSQEKIIRMSFSSNISEEYLKYLFEKIELIRSIETKTDIENCVVEFLKEFHIIYEDLTFEEQNTNVNEIVEHFNLLTSSENTYREHIWVKDTDCSYIIMMVYFSEEENNDLLLVSSCNNLNDEYKRFFSNITKGQGMISGFSDKKHSEETNADLLMEIFFFNEYDFFVKNEKINSLEDVVEYLT